MVTGAKPESGNANYVVQDALGQTGPSKPQSNATMHGMRAQKPKGEEMEHTHSFCPNHTVCAGTYMRVSIHTQLPYESRGTPQNATCCPRHKTRLFTKRKEVLLSEIRCSDEIHMKRPCRFIRTVTSARGARLSKHEHDRSIGESKLFTAT